MELKRGWVTKPLGEVVTFQRGFDLPYRLRVPGCVPVVSSAGITDFHAASMVDAPGVVTGRYGTIGEVFFLEEPFWPLNTTLFVRDFHGNDPLFVYYLLQRFDFKTFSGKSGVPGVNRNELHREPISFPSDSAEQRTIAQALKDVNRLLEGLCRLTAKKTGIRQAAIQQLVTGQTRLPGFSEEWEVKRLGSLGPFLKGRGVKKDEAQSGELPCVRYGEIYTHHNDYIKAFNSWISPEVAATATQLRKGDLLFACSGETKEEIGKCVALVDDVQAYAGGDIIILRPTNACSMFLGYLLNTTSINAQKASKGQGDAVVHISRSALSDIEIAIPSVEEQIAIAEVLHGMDEEIAKLEQRHEKTRALKQAMMQELLTGRTRLV